MGMGDPMLMQLLNQIRSAEQAEALHSLRHQVHLHMSEALQTVPIEIVYEQLNEVHDAAIRRCISLGESAMARLGKGSPPVPYAYLLFGSGGREEQTMSSDQDSGVIYGDAEHNPVEVKQYFHELSHHIVNNLLAAGYPPCEGNVISNNPQWCMSASEWEARVNSWFADPVWESIRYLLILADGRCVYGDAGLADNMKRLFFEDVGNNPSIEKRMLENTLRHKMLVGVFGQFLKEPYGEEAGSLDIKYGAYIPMVNAFRLMAIQSGIVESSTLRRIDSLIELGKLEHAEGKMYRITFCHFLRLRLLTTSQLEQGWYSSTGKLAGDKLTKELKLMLRRDLKVGKKLQQLVYKHTMSRLL